MLRSRSIFQSVEKAQQKLGFLLYLWYNKYGDENAGKERGKQRPNRICMLRNPRPQGSFAKENRQSS